MTIAVPELLMLGTTSAASASCCLAVPARAVWRVRALAAGMILLMAAMVTALAPTLQYALAVVVTALAASLIPTTAATSDEEVAWHERKVAWHRALGVMLMVLFVLQQVHDAAGATAPMAMGHGMSGTGHLPAHDVWLIHILQAWSVAYMVWTVVVVRRLRSAPHARWLRREHVAMSASVLAMAFLMT